MGIRQAKQSDATNISNLVKALAHFYLDDPENELPIWLSQSLTESAFLDRISSIDYVNFLYEKDNRVIGYISLKKPNHLYHLFVAEQFQSNGISRLLWEYLRNDGQYSSFTVRSSLNAIPVYKKFGFYEVGEIGNKDGVSFQPMELKL